MSDLVKHTLTINISDRIDWIDKRCGLTEIQKDYITAQMKDAVADAVQQANDVITGEKQCNLPVVMRCTCCGNTTKFSDGAKQQILIEEEYRYIYAVTCDECGKVCDVELFD